MDLNYRIITSLNIKEIINKNEVVTKDKIRDLSAENVKQLLKEYLVTFVIADMGKCFIWIDINETFDFWKTEVKQHLLNPNKTIYQLQEFPDEYCYSASEWDHGDNKIILLTKHH